MMSLLSLKMEAAGQKQASSNFQPVYFYLFLFLLIEISYDFVSIIVLQLLFSRVHSVCEDGSERALSSESQESCHTGARAMARYVFVVVFVHYEYTH